MKGRGLIGMSRQGGQASFNFFCGCFACTIVLSRLQIKSWRWMALQWRHYFSLVSHSQVTRTEGQRGEKDTARRLLLIINKTKKVWTACAQQTHHFFSLSLSHRASIHIWRGYQIRIWKVFCLSDTRRAAFMFFTRWTNRGERWRRPPRATETVTHTRIYPKTMLLLCVCSKKGWFWLVKV